MKRIVLVTWLGRRNYGTCLQSYALHKKIESLGYHVSFLLPLPLKYNIKYHVAFILSKIGLLNTILNWVNPPENLQEVKRRSFQRKNINLIRIMTKRQEEKLLSSTDCFITGSDQIWNTYYFYNPFYFLSFVNKEKKIAYASSIGTNYINEKYKEQVKKFLMTFSHIGVRESEAVKVLSDLTGRTDIRKVLDPTFLLLPSEWRSIAKDAVYEEEIPKQYIFCYLLGKNANYKEQLRDVAQKTGIPNILIIPATENKSFYCEGAEVYLHASPVEFVDLLQKAKFVCTDSFHATALSINHSIPFVEFVRFKDDDEKSQNSRIYDLLNHYDLNSRLYSKDSVEWAMPIDYHHVQDILIRDREESMEYLVNAIEN